MATLSESDIVVGHLLAPRVGGRVTAKRGPLARLRSNPQLYAGALLLVLIVVGALGAPLVTHYGPTTQDLVDRLKPPAWSRGGSTAHLLGTDTFGRDVFSRLLYGARYSLLVACGAVIGSGVIGIALGAIAGYAGGRTEAVIMRAVDAQQALSAILLALMVAALFGNSLLNLLIILAVTGWSTYTRILFGVVRSIRGQEYVIASVCLGARPWEVVVYHVLPNIVSPVIVISTLQVGRMLLLEAGLSFLGLGVPEPLPAWGTMLADGYRNIFTDSYLTTIPGIAITITVFGVNLLGDGLRRALDPHLRGT
ncbi:MAG TPA: ABC transporter permease [Candidatus Dormibacteraeota bacterium]|nr:ABC transporter permease [Candidatus Dormibacteraeota bacterium]